MRIRNALVLLALIVAPIVSVALVYYGPIWFLKAEIAQATEVTWDWMVRAYGVTPAMEDCLDKWGEPPTDFYSLWICAGGWVQAPHEEWKLPARTECFNMYIAAQNHMISIAVDASNAVNPDDPYFKPIDPQTMADMAEVAVEDLGAMESCLQGGRIGGDLHRDRD